MSGRLLSELKQRRLVRASGVQVEEEAAEPSDKLLMYLATAASAMGVDPSDGEQLKDFVMQLKALATTDKSVLIAKLKRFAGKDAKMLSKRALAT